jgi:addiction module HigA family antidote
MLYMVGDDRHTQLASDIFDRCHRKSEFGGPSLMAIKIHRSFAVHAGEWLKTEIIEAHGVLINDLAKAFGVSRPSISALLNGWASLSADMAIRFEHAFGVKAETQMRMPARATSWAKPVSTRPIWRSRA